MSNPGQGLTPAEAMVRIRMAMQNRDVSGARQIAEAARRDHPSDAALADAAGDLAMKASDLQTAEAHFAAARALAPGMLDYAINHAIALQRLARHGEVVALLAEHEKQGRRVARYGSVRALSHRTLGEPEDAARWYDAALTVEPRHPRALHGRARVAIERGEADALARFDKALSINSGDADLWLGKAQALEVAGDITGARAVAEQICAQAPGFIAALSFLAGLKLAAGEKVISPRHFAPQPCAHRRIPTSLQPMRKPSPDWIMRLRQQTSPPKPAHAFRVSHTSLFSKRCTRDPQAIGSGPKRSSQSYR